MTSSPAHRRVARALRAGGPETIEIEHEELPPLASGEVLIRVAAVGLNHAESLIRSGAYAIRFPFPYPVGLEGAGVVAAAGPGTRLTVGTRVCWTAVFGSCATFVIAPESMLAALPDPLSLEDGASVAHGSLTAAGLERHWPLASGSTAVVWGAAGAVGLPLVALLAERGVDVIGIASGARVEAVRAAGATHALDRAAVDVGEAVARATDGRGVSAVFDPIGEATYHVSLKLLAPRGCLINYGQLSGALPAVDLSQLMEAGSVFVTKYGPRAQVIGRHEIGAVISSVLALADRRRIMSEVAQRFTLDRVVEAYRALDSNPAGKILVLPGDET